MIDGIQFYSWSPPILPHFAFSPHLAPALADAAAIITVSYPPFSNGSSISTLTVQTTLGGSSLPDTIFWVTPPIEGASIYASIQTTGILVVALNKAAASGYVFTVSSKNSAGKSDPSLPASVPVQPAEFPPLPTPPPTVPPLPTPPPTVPPLPTETPQTTTPPDPPYNLSIVPLENSVSW